MRDLVFALDAIVALRHAAAADVDLCAAAMLAQLAGASAVRLGIDDSLKPVTERDVGDVRRVARNFELRMPPNPGLVKIALEARPNRVLLAAGAREVGEGLSAAQLPGTSGRALDLSGAKGRAFGGKKSPLESVMRPLTDAGIEVWVRIAPRIDAVNAAHLEGVTGVELYTGGIVDLPKAERLAELDSLREAVRQASKIRMAVGIGGGLGYATLAEVLDGAPAAGTVAVGREAVSRALLVGVDRALRDLKRLV